MGRSSRLLGHARELCQLGLSSQVFMPDLLDSLQALVPHDVSLFMWTDARGNLSNLCSRHAASPGVISDYLENFIDHEDGAYWPSFRDTMLSGTSNVLHDIHPGFYQSAMYARIWAPNRIYWGVDWTLRAGGCSLGSLRLYRERSGKPFTAADHARLLPLLPDLAHAVLHQPRIEDSVEFHQGTESGLLVLDGRGRCESMDQNGAMLLFYATHASLCPTSLHWRGGAEMPAQIKALCARVQRHASKVAVPPSEVLQMHNPWGLFVMRAQALHSLVAGGDSKVAVTIIRRHPLTLLWMARLRPYALSSRQTQVALLACTECTCADMAERLQLGEQTIIHHLREVYLKLDVHSREALRSKLTLPSTTRLV